MCTNLYQTLTPTGGRNNFLIETKHCFVFLHVLDNWSTGQGLVSGGLLQGLTRLFERFLLPARSEESSYSGRGKRMVVEDQSSPSSSIIICVFQQFHSNHGNLVQLSEDRLSAFRLRPSHEFNQGLVFSSLPLRNDEVFEVRIDRKVRA